MKRSFREYIDEKNRLRDASRALTDRYFFSWQFGEIDVRVEPREGEFIFYVLHPKSESYHGVAITIFTPDELEFVAKMRRLFDAWVKCEIEELPPPTSSRFAE